MTTPGHRFTASKESDSPPACQRILVIKPSSLGDVVHALPAVAALRAGLPDAHIAWLVNTEWAPLLEGNPHINEIIPFPRRNFRGLFGLWKAYQWGRQALRPRGLDLVVDFQGLARSGLICLAAGARRVLGFREAREGAAFFYTEKMAGKEGDAPVHAVDRYLKLAEAAGGKVEPPAVFSLPEGGPPPDLTEKESAFLAAPFTLLHPFSRGAGKSLSLGEVEAFCSESPLPVCVVGVGTEPPLALPETCLDLRGRTSLTQLLWLMRRAAWTVSVDSGPMHMAAGVTDRLLSIHTWTDPLMVGPYRREAWIYREGKIRRVGDLKPGDFPERRKDRHRPVSGPLLPQGAMSQLLAHIEQHRG